MDNSREKTRFKRITEVKSYLVPFRELPRPVYWFNDHFNAGTWSGLHCHENWGELAFMQSGYMVVCTEQGNFLAPPSWAIWIPPGQPHEWYVPQQSIDNGLYIMPAALAHTERFTRLMTLEITPLARELILSLITHPHAYEDGPVSRMADVLLDQVSNLPEIRDPIAMPHDHRLVELSSMLLSSPDIPNSIRDWCEQLGMSERTLARLFQQQAGISFGQWRQKIRLQYARNLLQNGENVTSVTYNCGYHSVSTFITLFRKKFGQTPGQYAASVDRERHDSTVFQN